MHRHISATTFKHNQTPSLNKILILTIFASQTNTSHISNEAQREREESMVSIQTKGAFPNLGWQVRLVLNGKNAMGLSNGDANKQEHLSHSICPSLKQLQLT